MAEETPMSPISEAVPPKANPLATPASAHAATLKLKPVIRRPVTGAAGATQTALKPGLKLPPKPGLSTTGLKLPPKPGATVSGLKPGIKLPARPVIRKPGATATTPSPLVPKAPAAATPVADMTPVEMTPVADLPKTAEAPKAEATVTELNVPKPEQPKPLDALKTVTQNLKSITSPIPQQAILRKTGIIADAAMTEAQKQAAKSKTARISLSDAMGVAPVKNEAMPMKTIRIKRPTDLPGVPSSTAQTKPATAVADVSAKPAEKPAETPAAEAASTSFTQRKTLKISRPGGGAVRPTGKFGVKKPSTAAATPAPAAPAAATSEPVADIADIPDLPSVPAAAPAPMAAGDRVPDVPKGVATVGLVVQIAACLAIAFLGWLLYQNTQLPYYCGGCLGM